MPKYKVIHDFNLSKKTVLIRVDLNVPISNDGIVLDNLRIEAIKKTVDHCALHGSKVILMSHFGRPSAYSADVSMQRLVNPISVILGRKILFEQNVKNVKTLVSDMSTHDVMLIENLRFNSGETKNDLEFARSLASLADIYVNDAFSCSHRSHASVDAITRFLPSCAGFALHSELENLSKIKCKKPLCAIVGGSKVSTKIDFIAKLVEDVNFIILGGAIANNFLAHSGIYIGRSIIEEGVNDIIQNIVDCAKKSGCSIILPCDAIVENNGRIYQRSIKDTQPDDIIYDAGIDSVNKIHSTIESSEAIIMNGPLGVFEKPEFRNGTYAILRALSEKKHSKLAVLGGGDTIAAVTICGFKYDEFGYISTGGGAFLEWFTGGESSMPGIAALIRSLGTC